MPVLRIGGQSEAADLPGP